MKANEICSFLQNQYLNTNDDSTRILKELHICNGRSIADLAVVNGTLNAFEIKSDADTLNRLPGQIEHYNRVFDYIIIVTGKSHLQKVSNIVPDFWGIWTISIVDNQIIKSEVRKESKNLKKDAFSIAQLLWKEEILDLLRKYNLHKGMTNKRKWLLWEFLAESFTINELTENAKHYLKARENWKVQI